MAESSDESKQFALPKTPDGSYQVVYLTGAPAAGKSTLAHALRQRMHPLVVFEYGEQLRAHLATLGTPNLTQTELRTNSSRIATPADIEHVDDALLEYVACQRQRAHVVVDTHAVTKEAYGFRITPFSLDRIAQLRPTIIVVMYTAPEVATARIAAAPNGRPPITPWEAGFHTALQSSVAVSYAVRLGVPVYLLDADRPRDELIDELARRIASPATRDPRAVAGSESTVTS